MYNATWIGAGTNTTGNNGLTIREYSAPHVYNSIFTEFGGNGVRITDARSGSFLTNGMLDLRDNLWWNFATNGVAVNVAGAGAALLFEDASRSNEVVNPQLRGISRAANGGLDPRPADGSPALSSLRTAPNDGFYTPVSYKGAFDANDLWVAGWTFLSQKGILPQRGANVIEVSGSIATDTTWYRTNEYVLNGFVYVLAGSSLTIEAGTVVKGRPGTDANTACLIVTAGAKIFANGTAHNPIIFTAEADDVEDPSDLAIFQRGLWGGVVVLGKAVLNTPSDIAGAAASPKYDVFEGLPSATEINGQFVNRFGGSDDDDSSGVLRYVSIRHAGVVFLPNKELNGLSMGAVGRGTVIENIESYAVADDGFEFFGGTVNTKYLVSAFNDDDAFDTDQGYRGKNQFWFAIQEPGRKDSGGEWNGEPSGIAASNAPLATFTVYNATWIGAGTNTTGNNGLTIREYSAPHVYNSIFTEFGGNGVRITDARSGSFLTNGTLDLRDNLWWNFATNGVAVNVAGAGASLLFEDASRSNEVVNPQLRGISRAANGGLDPRPADGSPALTSLRTAPNDGFYTPVSYKGAFNGVNWATDWTALGALGVITTDGAGVPAPVVGTPPPECSPANLSIVSSGGDVTITFTADTGASYQVQSTTDLGASPIQWTDEGAALSGTGTLTFSASNGGGFKFFRVVCQ
ncbi:MAG: T9SS C-terminal target domain-containing protein [Verrucomicrobia bacterium]|nr:T9SS C-terminal target domain-containing protein [Verrucomicrobiota bacterium]